MTEAKFDLLTPAEKRVVIAKDALKQIKNEFYRPRTGMFVSIQGDYDYDESLKKYFKDPELECYVCGKGALFCSLVHIKNKVTVTEANSVRNNEVIKALRGIFSESQLTSIEVAFEGYYPDYNSGVPSNFRKCLKFYREAKGGPEGRMIKILTNIVENNGTFKP